MKPAAFLFLLGSLFLFFSCTTESHRNRGSLSDAFEKSRDDSEEDRTVPDEEDDPWFYERDDENESEWDDESEPSYSGEDNPDSGDILLEGYTGESGLFLLLRAGSSIASSPYFDNPFDMEILLGTTREGPIGFFLFAGFKNLNVKPEDSLYESIDPDPFILHAGLEFRYYPLKATLFFNPYFCGRVSGFSLFWVFKNALIAGSETIHSDYVGGMGFDAGLGVDFLRTDTFQAGVQILPQGFLFSEETAEGFTNDYFGAFGDIRLTIEAGMTF